MNGSVPIGKIFGIPLRIHWSVLVLVVLLGYGLGRGTIPALAPGRGAGVYTVAGLLGALALLASLLLHESAHAVMARRRGVTVEDMTLWALGGVTRIGRAETPKAMLVISGCGPLASLLLAGVGIGGALAVRAGLGWNVAAAVLFWLGWANALLAGFNLLPAAPLDGGRIVQAVLWGRTGDRERAERAAGRSGQVVGTLLVALGVISFLYGSTGGLWLALIGFFLSGTAGAEAQRAGLSAALHGVPVARAMSAPVVTSPEWLTVSRFLDEMESQRRHSAIPLLDFDGRPSGVVTMRQLAAVPGPARGEVRLRDVATPLSRCTVATPDEDLLEVLGRASASPRILVVDGGRLVGIVTTHDITRLVQLLKDRRDAPR
ncbi:site-2 protease family protein [Streptantibioticus rubrisoli]|uniref:Zinc metalloprotease n=1 Tax=Streptantibioticus rubrisoli TaxID=1387313 RepID=A0ABT1P7K9_9ACTN|nr:site-2 protease family protein [Streptantibioticus rubrisoli]MCQ4041362.1 site-2 protease family protein [Streptantibioticus rubrisoli]